MTGRDELVVTNRSMARAIAYRFWRRLPICMTVDDLEQEALIVMLKIVRSDNRPWNQLENYVYTAVLNHFRHVIEYEQRQRRDFRTTQVWDFNQVPGIPNNTEMRILAHEVMSSAPVRDQDALYRRFWLDQTTDEIACGRTAQYGTNRVHSALRRIRKTMDLPQMFRR